MDGFETSRVKTFRGAVIRRHNLCEFICLLIVLAGDVIKLDTIEFVLESAYGVAVCFHLLIVATHVLHDLVNYELQVSPDIEALDACFDGDLLDAGKCKRTAYLICSLRGEMKSSPTPAPVFITDPSK
jgi:hypothetical protein